MFTRTVSYKPYFTLFLRLEMNSCLLTVVFGPGSSVGIATDCGLDGPGSNPVGDEIFRLSKPALGPTQPSVNGYRLFPWGLRHLGRGADPPTPSSAEVLERVELYLYSP